jgi:Fur family ferric uptake transcriptional regulator
MEPCDDSPRIVDLIASFGSKKPLPRKRKHAATTAAETGLPMSSQEHRLAASRLRPTIVRSTALNALEQATPSCLDASQMYRVLSRQIDSLTPGSVCQALNDLWTAGLLIRTEGARGRAFYTIKPAALNRYDTLRCHCGARLVFLEDPVLLGQLRSLASKNGFVFDEESGFTITTTCSKCQHLRKVTKFAVEGSR